MIKISVSFIILILLSISCTENIDSLNIFGTYEGIESAEFFDMNSGYEYTEKQKTIEVKSLGGDFISIDNIQATFDPSLSWTSEPYETKFKFYSYRFRNDSLYVYSYQGSRGAGWTYEFNGLKN